MTIPSDAFVTSFEEGGYFWLPGEPGDRVHGRLLCDPGEHIVVELDGAFVSTIEVLDNTGKRVPIRYPFVHGQLSSGNRVTLWNAYQGRHRSSSHSAASQIHPQYTFIGDHYTSDSALAFSRYSVWLSSLEDWVWNSGIDFNVKLYEMSSSSSRLQFSFARREPVTIELDGVQIHIVQAPSWSYQQGREFTFTQRNQITFDLNSPKDVVTFVNDVLGPVTEFLALAICRPIWLLHVCANMPLAGILHTDDPRINDSATPITILYSLRQSTGKLRTQTHPLEMLLPLNAVREHLEEYLKRWFELYGPYQDILENFWGLIHTDQLSPHFRFLGLVSVMEAYHARKERKRRAELKDRLKTLFNKAQEVLALPNYNENFVDRFVSTRNYYSHYDQRRRKKCFDVEEMHAANKFLEWVFFSILLRWLGMPDKQCEETFAQNQLFIRFQTYLWPALIVNTTSGEKR